MTVIHGWLCIHVLEHGLAFQIPTGPHTPPATALLGSEIKKSNSWVCIRWENCCIPNFSLSCWLQVNVIHKVSLSVVSGEQQSVYNCFKCFCWELKSWLTKQRGTLMLVNDQRTNFINDRQNFDQTCLCSLLCLLWCLICCVTSNLNILSVIGSEWHTSHLLHSEDEQHLYRLRAV